MTMDRQAPSPTHEKGSDASLAKPLKTIVYARLEDDAVKFTLFPDDDDAADKFKKDTIHLPTGSGSHEIHFRLVDGTRRKLRFDDTNPMWAQDGVDCPAQGKFDSSQIRILRTQGGGTLVIEDLHNNAEPLKIGYQLNFIDRNGIPVPFDPIIINDGGGRFD